MDPEEDNDEIIARLMPEIQRRVAEPGALDAWIATLTPAEQAAITSWIREPGDRISAILKRIDEEIS
jgi:hypothetical protein